MSLRKNIEDLLKSDVTAHAVAKETGITRNAVYKLFNGESNIDNITLKNAEILSNYWEEKKMKLKEVFVADNGDVFFKHDNFLAKRSKDEINQVITDAQAKYENGEFTVCKAEVSEVSIAYSVDGEFIANADIHVTNKFFEAQNYIYLHRRSDKTDIGKLYSKIVKN